MRRHELTDNLFAGCRFCVPEQWRKCPVWMDECERWLGFLKEKGAWEKFHPRLTARQDQFWETLGEIEAAYFLERVVAVGEVRLSEPPGSDGHVGDLTLTADTVDIYCEVKCLGWKQDVKREEGRRSPRLQGNKFEKGGNKVYRDRNADYIRGSVEREYADLPCGQATLHVIRDDLTIPELWIPPYRNVHFVCYHRPEPPPYPDQVPGVFMTDQFRNLGGVVLLLPEPGEGEGRMNYRHVYARNSRAVHPLPGVLSERLQCITEARACPLDS